MFKFIRFSGSSSVNGTEHCVKLNLAPPLRVLLPLQTSLHGITLGAELRLRSRFVSKRRKHPAIEQTDCWKKINIAQNENQMSIQFPLSYILKI